jgi:hypothetical protein
MSLGNGHARTATRRALQLTIDEAVPVVNRHSELFLMADARFSASEARIAQLEQIQAEWRAQSLINRFLWLVRGHA